MIWIKRVGYILLVMGILVMLGDFIVNGLFMTGAFLFAGGVAAFIIVASQADAAAIRVSGAFQIWRALLVVGLLAWFPNFWLVEFGLSGSAITKSRGTIEIFIFTVPLTLAIFCLILALDLKNKGKQTVAVWILTIPFIWGALGALVIYTLYGAI